MVQCHTGLGLLILEIYQCWSLGSTVGTGLMKALLGRKGNTSLGETRTALAPWINTRALEHNSRCPNSVCWHTAHANLSWSRWNGKNIQPSRQCWSLDDKVRRKSFCGVAVAMTTQRCGWAVHCYTGEMKPKRHRLGTVQQLIDLNYMGILSRRDLASATNDKKSISVQVGKRKLRQYQSVPIRTALRHKHIMLYLGRRVRSRKFDILR